MTLISCGKLSRLPSSTMPSALQKNDMNGAPEAPSKTWAWLATRSWGTLVWCEDLWQKGPGLWQKAHQQPWQKAAFWRAVGSFDKRQPLGDPRKVGLLKKSKQRKTTPIIFFNCCIVFLYANPSKTCTVFLVTTCPLPFDKRGRRVCFALFLAKGWSFFYISFWQKRIQIERQDFAEKNLWKKVAFRYECLSQSLVYCKKDFKYYMWHPLRPEISLTKGTDCERHSFGI